MYIGKGVEMEGTEKREMKGKDISITLCCISKEASNLLETVMEEWGKWKDKMPRKPQDEVYSFAYWLIRWSNLVEPSRKIG